MHRGARTDRMEGALRNSDSDHSALSTQHSALPHGPRAAVFLDKDGTVIEDVPFNCDVRRMALMTHAAEGLRRLQQAGFALIVVSNQAGVARGYFPEKALRAVADGLGRLLAREGVRLDGFYWCPHDPDGRVAPYAVACSCRKPLPGLIERAAIEQRMALGRSWMIGDILHDVEAGRRAGCRTVLIDNGHETEWKVTGWRWPDGVARDLVEAAAFIIDQQERATGHVAGGMARSSTKPTKSTNTPTVQHDRADDGAH